jgi:hypothetical protein
MTFLKSPRSDWLEKALCNRFTIRTNVFFCRLWVYFYAARTTTEMWFVTRSGGPLLARRSCRFVQTRIASERSTGEFVGRGCPTICRERHQAPRQDIDNLTLMRSDATSVTLLYTKQKMRSVCVTALTAGTEVKSAGAGGRVCVRGRKCVARWRLRWRRPDAAASAR